MWPKQTRNEHLSNKLETKNCQTEPPQSAKQNKNGTGPNKSETQRGQTNRKHKLAKQT